MASPENRWQWALGCHLYSWPRAELSVTIVRPSQPRSTSLLESSGQRGIFSNDDAPVLSLPQALWDLPRLAPVFILLISLHPHGLLPAPPCRVTIPTTGPLYLHAFTWNALPPGSHWDLSFHVSSSERPCLMTPSIISLVPLVQFSS